jgi:hypothetical protein
MFMHHKPTVKMLGTKSAIGRNFEPSATIFDGHMLLSTPESGDRASHDGAKKKMGSEIHAVVDTLGNLLALETAPTNEQERAQVSDLAKRIQEVTGGDVQVAFVYQGYIGDDVVIQAEREGIRLEVVRRHLTGERVTVECCGGCWGRAGPGPESRAVEQLNS